MKKLLLVITVILLAVDFSYSQASNNLDRFPNKLWQKDTLTTAIDTMDISFNSDIGIESYTVTAYCPSGADTVQAFSLNEDGVTWSQRGLLHFGTGGAVATIVAGTTAYTWQVYKTDEMKLRLISTSNDGSITVVIVVGKKRDAIR